MKPNRLLIAGLGAFAFSSVQGQETAHVTAENGVVLNVLADEFAGRRDVLGPTIHLMNPRRIPSYAYVARSISTRTSAAITVQGELTTIGANPSFAQITPILRGGEALPFQITSRQTRECTSICSYSYHFIVQVSEHQIDNHRASGAVVIQFRSADGTWRPTLSIPLSHFEAVRAYRG